MRRIAQISAAVAAVVLAGCTAPPSDAPEPADLLIRGARIVDGTGGPWFSGNLAVAGDTIVSVGPGEPDAVQVLDAEGLVLAPGFIDMHAHSEYGLVVDPRALSKTAQGVTTEVLGEHLSAGPVMGPAVDDPMMVAPPIERDWTTLGGYLDRLEFAGVGPNVVSYVGSGQVRASVVGYEERDPTEEETPGDGGARRAGDGGGGVRAGERHVLHPERLHEHGGTDPADPGGGRVRRHLREPPARRARGARGGDHHRPGGGNRARDPPPELHLERPDSGVRGDDRRGPGCGRGRDRERLSVHRGLDLPALAAAGLGAGGRRGPDARAVDGPGRTGTAAGRTPGVRGPAAPLGAYVREFLPGRGGRALDRGPRGSPGERRRKRGCWTS